MVCNNIFGCISPPEWKINKREVRSTDQRRRFCGYTFSQILISLSSDTDIATDYLYFIRTVPHREHIPAPVMMALAICLGIATLLWLLEVVEGRMGCKKCCGFRLTNTQILWAGVLLEDIPQIVLTTMIDMIYLGSFTAPGVANIAASMHDALTKIRSLLDDDIDEDWKMVPEPLLDVKPGLTEAQVATLSAEV